jgi:alkylhydroperoxidase family enzyme
MPGPTGRYIAAMSRLPLVSSDDEQADPLAREVLKAVAASRGRSVDPNVYRAVANHPRALQKMVEFGTVVYFQNSMTPAQRELAYLTASVTNECHY